MRLVLYHSLEKTHKVESCGAEEYLLTKYDMAIVYVNMLYFMYPMNKHSLGKRKRPFWGQKDQEILVSLVDQNQHLPPKDIGKKYLEETACALQSPHAIIEKIYNIKQNMLKNMGTILLVM